MKEIILVRHGTAETSNTDKDLSRKLISKGIEESHNVGLFLARLQKEVGIILTSHAKRASETADCIQSIVYRKIRREINMILYSGEMTDYLEAVQKLDNIYRSVLIIGHYPVLKELASYFSNSNGSGISFPKGSVYCFKFDCNLWEELSTKNTKLSVFMNKEAIKILLDQSNEKKSLGPLKNQYLTTKKLHKRLKREGFKTGLTHDLRIMSRKWLSLMELSCCFNETLQTTINNIMRTTGKYRDRCVQTKILKKTNSGRSIYIYWNKKKAKQKKQVAKTFKNQGKQDIISTYQEVYEKIINERERLSNFEMKSNICESLNQLKINSQVTLEDNKTELHEFRLKAKDIRYKIEFYKTINQEELFDTELEQLIFLQKSLGKMRDYEKLINKITKQSDRFDNEEIQNTVNKIQKLLKEKWMEVSDFLENNPSFLKESIHHKDN